MTDNTTLWCEERIDQGMNNNFKENKILRSLLWLSINSRIFKFSGKKIAGLKLSARGVLGMGSKSVNSEMGLFKRITRF